MHTKEKIVREDDLAALEAAKAAGYELRDYRLGPILWTLAALTALGLAGFGLMYFTFVGFEKVRLLGQPNESFSKLSHPEKPATQHRLTVDVDRELNEVKAAVAKNIESYGYVDQAAGVARIPVSRSLEIVIEQGGLPVFGAGGTVTFPDKVASAAAPGAATPTASVHQPAPSGAAHGAAEPAATGASASPAPGFAPQFEPEVHQTFPEASHR